MRPATAPALTGVEPSPRRMGLVWVAAIPLLAIAGLYLSPPPQRVHAVMVAAFACLLVQWLLPQARFRVRNYFSPVNVALLLLHIKILAAPVLLMIFGYENKIGALTPRPESVEWAVLIDIVAYLAFCLGLQYATARVVEPGRFSLLPALSRTPGRTYIYVFAGLGVLGMFLTFGSVGRLLEYFSDPAAVLETPEVGGWVEFLGTIFRPFLAFALITWWSRKADENLGRGTHWGLVLAGCAAAAGITAANLTYSFNRGAVVFPLLALLAVYSARIRRIPPVLTFTGMACCIPLLMAVGSFRSNSQLARVAPSAVRSVEVAAGDLVENVLVYCGGPQLTAAFYESLDFGDRLYGGSTLVSSVLSPIPILGKGFREDSGPTVYNRAVYGSGGIDDQIPPFASELFGNFHIAGVVAGFIALSFLLARLESWMHVVESVFGAFVIQYIAVWGAMLAVWSLSIYAQILFYFLGPVYLYLAAVQVSSWLRRTPPRPNFISRGSEIQ